MRRVVGAVCIGSNSGSTNFLLQATANKVSRRALLDHMFRLRSTASLRFKHCHFVVPSMFCLQNSTVACDKVLSEEGFGLVPLSGWIFYAVSV